MLVEITNVTISQDNITIEALAIENILMADDLFEDVEVPTVRYTFSRVARNGAEMKYLWKICQSQKKCAAAKNMGEKLKALEGSIIQLADSFRN